MVCLMLFSVHCSPLRMVLNSKMGSTIDFYSGFRIFVMAHTYDTLIAKRWTYFSTLDTQIHLGKATYRFVLSKMIQMKPKGWTKQHNVKGKMIQKHVLHFHIFFALFDALWKKLARTKNGSKVRFAFVWGLFRITFLFFCLTQLITFLQFLLTNIHDILQLLLFLYVSR